MTASANAVPSPALGIGGMHRSGTSLTASLLATAGIHLGDELMPAGAGNPRGHFEDLEFYHLHQRILAANGLSLEGFTCQEEIIVPPAARAQAIELVTRRRAAGRPWGWKDPRTVLLLDFWADLLPEARWLFVVRSPEEVVDSLLRRGDTAFVMNPRHAIDVWAAYNRRILEFVHRHRHRSVVVDLDQVVANPAGVVSAVASLLGVRLPAPTATYEAGLLTAGQPAHRAGLVRILRPDAHELHMHLRRLAGLEAAPTGGPLQPLEATDAALAEWAIACRTAAAGGQSTDREAEARREIDRLEATLCSEQRVREELAARAEALTTDLEAARAAHADALGRSAELERHAAACEESLAEVTARHTEATTELAAVLDSLTANRDRAEAVQEALERELADAQAQATAAGEAAAALDAVLAARDATVVRLEGRLAERDLAATRLEEQLAERDLAVTRLEEQLAERDLAVMRLEEQLAERDLAVTRLREQLAERDLAVTRLETKAANVDGERRDLVAQLEAERAIHEALRQDMTGRIEAAVSGRGRARSAV